MLQLLFFILSLSYEPRDWLVYPSLAEVSSITTSSRAIYVAVPDGIYIFNPHRYQHLRTLTSADGIAEKIKLCAFNPAQNELLIATDSHLYHFLPTTDRVLELNPPFKNVHSIGITPTSAFFDTESGLFRKERVADSYTPVAEVPEPVTWFGKRDTTHPRMFTFLTPYFILDEQLNPHPFTKVWVDEKRNRLFVVAQDYGIVVYNLRSGFKEKELRLGPVNLPIQQVLSGREGLWLLSQTQAVLIDSAGNWHYFSSRPGEITPSGLRLVIGPLLDLHRQEKVTALFSFTNNSLLLATENGLYFLSPERKPQLISRLNTRVNALAWVRESTLVGTDYGLFLLVDSGLTQVTDPFAKSDWGVFSITQTQQTTFFGIRGGILQLDSTNTWTQLIPPGFDLSQPVRTMAATGELLFIGEKDRIIAYNLKHHTWTTIDQSNGLPSGKITALYADGRYLWIFSPGMVARYTLPTSPTRLN